MEDAPEETHDTNEVILKAIEDAKDLVALGEKRRLARDAAWANLPLLEPGSEHNADEVRFGFRVLDGFHVGFCPDDSVRIGDVRAKDAQDGKINCFVNRWPEGIAWCYWSDATRSRCGKSLAECVMDFGMGGWIDPVQDLQAKLVYTDASRSYRPGHCFILAMSRVSATQDPVKVKGHEASSDVYRVYRSALSRKLHDVIGMRELLNLTEKPIPPQWWQWAKAPE